MNPTYPNPRAALIAQLRDVLQHHDLNDLISVLQTIDQQQLTKHEKREAQQFVGRYKSLMKSRQRGLLTREEFARGENELRWQTMAWIDTLSADKLSTPSRRFTGSRNQILILTLLATLMVVICAFFYSRTSADTSQEVTLLQGVVKSTDNRPLRRVRVTTLNYHTYTNDQGYFELFIPPTEDLSHYLLNFSKTAFTTQERYYNPNGGPLEVRLQPLFN